VAIEVSQENAAQNGLDGTVRFEMGDLDSGLEGRQGDLVMANIQADVLMKFANGLVRAVRPGGELVLSGILAAELETVRAVFSTVAFGARMESRLLGEWSDLVIDWR
jgi:ribosomal protein L11 methyltransferase